MFSTHPSSFHQCPGVMPGFIRVMAKRAQLAAYASRDERSPGPQYGLQTMDSSSAAAFKHPFVDIQVNTRYSDLDTLYIHSTYPVHKTLLNASQLQLKYMSQYYHSCTKDNK